MKSVLTGFKYIGGEILALEQEGQEHRYIFGFEESCGYLKGTYARDKDAVVASMLVCEMAAYYKSKGMSVLDALEALYQSYGYFLAKVVSIELTGADAMDKAAAILSNFRQTPPAEIGGARVSIMRDYKARTSMDMISGKKSSISLPESNVLEFILGEQGSVIVRPSGTEPKVKFYYTAVGSSRQNAQTLLDALVNDMTI